MLVIFSPDFGLTNSLLINMPVGRVNFLPLGAVRSIERSDILQGVERKQRCWTMEKDATELVERREEKRSKGRACLNNIKDSD
jgi:hypothetical protein